MVSVATLRRELEQLFPGKWLSGGESSRALKTGLEQIDLLSSGLLRRHVTEWVGNSSSGKTTVLRTICANWCASGLNIIYVDTFDRLIASDWCSVDSKGRFWVLRSKLEDEYGKRDYLKDALWACEQLIRSRVFDVVILDLAERGITSSIYTRFKRSLERSNTSLIVLRDDSSTSPRESGWGSSMRLDFNFAAPIRSELGVSGIATIVPTIKGSICRDGMSKNMEVSVAPYVQNRLFTHPPVPDRRTPKNRT